MGLSKILDFVFLVYFIIHIPVAIFIDSQALLPRWIYPKQVQDLMSWYCSEFKDTMMTNPPAWFQSFVFCEMFFQLPFFFVASYVFIKGIHQYPWIQKPMVIYGAHTATTTIAITFHLFFHDFRLTTPPGPDTMEERLRLFAIYCPFLIIPIILLLNFSCRSFPRQKAKRN